MMTECPYCRKSYKVYDMFLGIAGHCLKCGKEFTVAAMHVSPGNAKPGDAAQSEQSPDTPPPANS